MKNIKKLLIALAALMGTAAMANMAQPSIQADEDAPIRFQLGAGSGFVNHPSGHQAEGFGVGNITGALGFTHNVGYDFEYGLSVHGGAATWGSKLFSKHATDNKLTGTQMNVNAMLRYMPEVADDFNAGLTMGFGWGHLFNSTAADVYKNQVSFGDLDFRVGPAMSYRFSDTFAAYWSPSFTISNIRLLKDGATEAFRNNTNLFGMEIPVGGWFEIADSTGLYVEVNNAFNNFNRFADSWRISGTLGLAFAM